MAYSTLYRISYSELQWFDRIQYINIVDQLKEDFERFTKIMPLWLGIWGHFLAWYLTLPSTIKWTSLMSGFQNGSFIFLALVVSKIYNKFTVKNQGVLIGKFPSYKMSKSGDKIP